MSKRKMILLLIKQLLLQNNAFEFISTLSTLALWRCLSRGANMAMFFFLLIEQALENFSSTLC